MTAWPMLIACWINKARNTHSEYKIVIACPLQQWLHERASMLRYSTSPFLKPVTGKFQNVSEKRVSYVII